MTTEEQLSILKQGIDAWNQWRIKNATEKVDLRGAYLADVNLARGMLSEFDFGDGNVVGVDFRGADLREVSFRRANLSEADFSGANLIGTNFSEANLTRASFIRANLSAADFRRANLSEAKLSEASLGSVRLARTAIIDVDLQKARSLELVQHVGPSSISANTLKLSQGKIPEAFLRGCGLSDWEIESAKLYNPDLGNEEIDKILYKIHDIRATQAVQISPLFISYSQIDSIFVDKVERNLNRKGIRFWRDIHDMKSGRMEKQIDRAMRLNPTVLLILSEHSLQSDWVEHEVRTARALQKELKKDVLCPVALDDKWKNSPWAKRIMEQIMEFNILDFSEWKDDAKFGSTFDKLIDGLELFYK
jgi:uncharacterized protein YjbI with pentapeptide repeats